MYLLLTRRSALQWGGACVMAWPGLAGAAPMDDIWRDAARSRDLPLRLRLPATPGPWPLVLYSHGLGGSIEGGAVWGEAWSRAGIAVLHLQHPGSDSDTLQRGLGPLRAAASPRQLLARAADVRFALDELERRARGGAAPWREIRLDALGLAGHSFGAHTTLAVAGQRYRVPSDLADTRPKAFVALSPSSPAAGGMALQASFGAITRPLLVVTGSLDGDPFGSYDTGERRAEVYDGLPPGQRALLWLDGADHMTFGGGRPGPSAGRGPFARQPLAQAREAAHHELVARLSTQWWRAHLLGDGAAQAALRQPSGLAEKDRLVLG